MLAWLRVLAEEALDPGPIEDWHRYALPSFATRLAERLGDSCATGHDPWPGAPRHASYRAAKPSRPGRKRSTGWSASSNGPGTAVDAPTSPSSSNWMNPSTSSRPTTKRQTRMRDRQDLK